MVVMVVVMMVMVMVVVVIGNGAFECRVTSLVLDKDIEILLRLGFEIINMSVAYGYLHSLEQCQLKKKSAYQCIHFCPFCLINTTRSKGNHSVCCAVGCKDGSVSVWTTDRDKPLLVLIE